MNEREYAAWVFDSALPDQPQIIGAGDLRGAQRTVEHYRRIDKTRGAAGVAAKVVFRYRFMPDMPWEDA